MVETNERSAPALVGDLIGNVTELFRKELQLLRAELSEKSTQAIAALGSVAAGLVVALTALNVLAAALVVALERAGIPGAWPALIVGVGLAILAFFLVRGGIAALKASSLAPDRTAHALARDAALAKEQMP
jgi:TRAP-type C4-dicarboxylate transport system permease small subunit